MHLLVKSLLLTLAAIAGSKPAASAPIAIETRAFSGSVQEPKDSPAPAAKPEEKATFDLATYKPPAPWKKTAWKKDDSKPELVSYTSTDNETGTYCQMFLLRCTVSKGDVTTDFDSAWQNLVVKSYKITGKAEASEVVEENGWKAKGAVVAFDFNSGTSIAIMTTISGYNRTMSIVAVTSGQDYLPAIQTLLESVKMTKPSADLPPPAKPAEKDAATPAALQGYMDYNPFTKTWTWKVRYPPPK